VVEVSQEGTRGSDVSFVEVVAEGLVRHAVLAGGEESADGLWRQRYCRNLRSEQ